MNREVLEELILNINSRTGIRNEILEKDYYVCLILKNLSIKQKELQAYFKGGTAVYKILDQMNRFSEDIDLTVKVNETNSRNSNRTRLKKSALDYQIDGLELIKSETIDLKGSITAFYKYESLFKNNELFKSGRIQVESTSFTVSEPTSIYTIMPLIYKYANKDEKLILKNSYGISEFDIEIVTLERIFVDKIFAIQFYYERNQLDDCAKHLYDICILIKDKNIKNLFNNQLEMDRLINLKRKEETFRIGGVSSDIPINEFSYLKYNLSKEMINSFLKMQNIYVLDDSYKITIQELKDTLKTLFKLFSKKISCFV